MTVSNIQTKDIVMIKGPTGAGKTRGLQARYQFLLGTGVRADLILVLVRNRRQSIFWRDTVKPKISSNMRIQSYFGFVQGEIKKYWTAIKSKIDGFKHDMIEPVFLTTEASQFLLTKLVENFRHQGKLMDITANSQRIVIEALSNLSRAIAANIHYKDIGVRLLSSSLTGNGIKERLFADFQDLLIRYIKDCKDNGFIDYSLAIYIYNNYLLNDGFYRERLKKETAHLIVDGLEEAVSCEVDLINIISDFTETCTLSFSTDGTFSRKQGACPEYAEKIIMPKVTKMIELKECFTCGKDLYMFSDVLYSKFCNPNSVPWSQVSALSTQDSELHFGDLPIFSIQAEIRSEMIMKVCEEIQVLIDEGLEPKDIVVICPIADSVLEYCLKSFFKKRSIGVVNISRTSRYIDESFIRALITLACLCHPQWDMNPPEHDIANLLGMVLGLDPVRSSLIAREVVNLKPFTLPAIDNLEFRERVGFMNSDKYQVLKNWIEKYREGDPLPINNFFQSAFITILLNLPRVESHINACRLLIESAANFLKTIGISTSQDPGKNFIEMVKQGVKPAETIQDLEQKIYSDHLIISTPQSYLASSMNRKVQIWVDTSSPLWYRSDVEELTNPHVFSPDWKEGDVWTEELDERFKMLKCSVLVKQLMRRCTERVILAESQYNQDGYENDGILADIMGEIAYETTT